MSQGELLGSHFLLLSALFPLLLQLQSQVALLTCHFQLRISQKKALPDKKSEGSRRGGGRATRRLGAAAAVSHRSSHLQLQTSHRPNENVPRKKCGGSRRGGGRATRRLGAASAVSDRTSHLPPRTSHHPNENVPRKKMGGLTQGGGRATRRLGATSAFSLLSSLFSRSCCFASHFSPATSNFASSHCEPRIRPSTPLPIRPTTPGPAKCAKRLNKRKRQTQP